jgi:LPS-assembly lipoprotein
MLKKSMRPLSHTALLLLLAPFLVLGGCYQPLYGTKAFSATPSAAESRLNQVAIANIPDETGQKLRNLLIDRFYINGRPLRPDYELLTRLTIFEEKLGLRKDATTSRARLSLTADYDVIESATRKKIFSGISRSSVSYNILDQQFATLSSKENAVDRGLRELSEMITTRLLLALEKQAQSEPAAKAAP